MRLGVESGGEMSLSMDTPSSDSASDAMTHPMRGCDIDHRVFRIDGGWRIGLFDRW